MLFEFYLVGSRKTDLLATRIILHCIYYEIFQKLRSIKWKDDPYSDGPGMAKQVFRKALWLTGISKNHKGPCEVVKTSNIDTTRKMLFLLEK